MKLYALMDEESLRLRGWSMERFIERSLSLGAELLQYRNKIDNPELVEKKLKIAVSLFSGRVIVNDYPELANICGGVHLGQEDLLYYGSDLKDALKLVRKKAGSESWIGISTHNEEEILKANELDIDYIGLGACRATGTKKEASVLGIEKIKKLAALSTHPVAVIGGVRLDDRIEGADYLVIGSALYYED